MGLTARKVQPPEAKEFVGRDQFHLLGAKIKVVGATTNKFLVCFHDGDSCGRMKWWQDTDNMEELEPQQTRGTKPMSENRRIFGPPEEKNHMMMGYWHGRTARLWTRAPCSCIIPPSSFVKFLMVSCEPLLSTAFVS